MSITSVKDTLRTFLDLTDTQKFHFAVVLKSRAPYIVTFGNFNSTKRNIIALVHPEKTERAPAEKYTVKTS